MIRTIQDFEVIKPELQCMANYLKEKKIHGVYFFKPALLENWGSTAIWLFHTPLHPATDFLKTWYPCSNKELECYIDKKAQSKLSRPLNRKAMIRHGLEDTVEILHFRLEKHFNFFRPNIVPLANEKLFLFWDLDTMEIKMVYDQLVLNRQQVIYGAPEKLKSSLPKPVRRVRDGRDTI